MRDIFKCSLLETLVIPSFGLGSVVLIIGKCAHPLKRNGTNGFKGRICAQLGKMGIAGFAL